MSRRNTCPKNGNGLDSRKDQPVKTTLQSTINFIADDAFLASAASRFNWFFVYACAFIVGAFLGSVL